MIWKYHFLSRTYWHQGRGRGPHLAAAAVGSALLLVGASCLDEEGSEGHLPAKANSFLKSPIGRYKARINELIRIPRSYMEAAEIHNTSALDDVVIYDYVVLGNGNAGKSAAETLRTECPGAKIAVVDPLRPGGGLGVDHWSFGATGFCPASRLVHLAYTPTKLKYRHAILVATGSRGAPPPPSVFDKESLLRVLELRPTHLAGNGLRPVLPTESVRKLAMMAVSEGATVGILGSGWEAVELAVAASVKRKNKPLLTFGSAGPLSQVLPRYLSVEVTKKLRNHGINVLERRLVKYVANAIMAQGTKLEVHSSISYDTLDTQRDLVDLLLIVPSVDGARGTAVLPSVEAPPEMGGFDDQTRYQTWSQLTSPPTKPSAIACFADDGRIAVNAELCAASRVYAAGSVAKYPNSMTGHAQVAGEGIVDGSLAGHVAALQMIGNCSDGRWRSKTERTTFAEASFPIFRSDFCHGNESRSATLAKVGIQALCVGRCDSDRMTTHAFWWTNQSARQASKIQLSNQKQRREPTGKRPPSPVYGSGIVFYLDRTGRLRGVMSWGIPFTADNKGTLNAELVDRMKAVVATNGAVSLRNVDGNELLTIKDLAEESKKLVAIALSRHDPTTALSRNIQLRVDSKPNPLYRYTAGRPPSITSVGMLKRKDQVGASELLSENVYVKDEDDYQTVDTIRPSSLVYVYPLGVQSTVRGNGESSWNDPYRLSETEKQHLLARDNDKRGRPPKEEPLWLRRDEMHKGIKYRDSLVERLSATLRSGRFADGSDPVQQAPMPRVLQAATKQFQSMIDKSKHVEEGGTEAKGHDDDEGAASTPK